MQIVLAVVAILVLSIPLLISLWALLDAARRPEWAFALAGRSRVVWVAACAIGMPAVYDCGIGWPCIRASAGL